MNTIDHFYMTCDISKMEEGLDWSIWISPDKPNVWERPFYPHVYAYEADKCRWTIRANMPISPKQLAFVCEYADDMCAKTKARNEKRKLANRK